MPNDTKDHWITRILFDISPDPVVRRLDLGTVYFAFLCGVILTVAFAFILSRGPRVGLPEQSELIEVSGTIREARLHRGGTVYFSLAETLDKFSYSSKAGDGARVFDLLSIGSKVAVWHEPFSERYRAGEKTLDIFQIEIDGRMVRSYKQVEDHWLADNRLTPWLLLGAILGTTYFIAYIRLARKAG